MDLSCQSLQLQKEKIFDIFSFFVQGIDFLYLEDIILPYKSS